MSMPATDPYQQGQTLEPPSPDQILAGLDPEQQRVASELDGPMCVLAGAGTGKTRAITHRIAYAIASGRYVPQRVLALTFTSRAAEQMRIRLRQLGAPGVQARTFHSAALRQLKYFWPQAVGGSPPQILNHKGQLISEAAQRLRISTNTAMVRDLAGEIEWAKVSMLTPDTLRGHLAERKLPADMSELNLTRLFRAYEELKDDRNLIDFEDVLLLTVAMLEEAPEVAAAVRQQYRHFVVDEYQDVSPLQQRLLQAWLGGRTDLCVVGDASQTIYSFTGATSSYLQNFSAQFSQATVVKLTRDYRSSPQVVKLANQLLAARKTPPDLKGKDSWPSPLFLQSQRPDGPQAQWFEFADDQQEAAGLAQDIKQLIKKGVKPSQIAILYRTNSQSLAFEQALSERGIPYQLRGAEQFFNRAEVRQAVLQLRAAARTESSQPVTAITRDALKALGYTEQGPASSGQLRQRWESLAALVSMAETLETQREQARDQGHKDQQGRPLSPLSMQEFMAELAWRIAEQDAPVLNGVTLSSLHSAKGLEWEAVFLAGLSEGLLPISYAQSWQDMDEERRLFYVGITRAKQYLTFSWSRSRTPGGRTNRKRSRFVTDIAPRQGRPSRRRLT